LLSNDVVITITQSSESEPSSAIRLKRVSERNRAAGLRQRYRRAVSACDFNRAADYMARLATITNVDVRVFTAAHKNFRCGITSGGRRIRRQVLIVWIELV